MPIYRLENTIQPYEWGSGTAISELLGKPVPSKEPEAELWLGTHPKGPSTVITKEGRISLHEMIAQRPVEILGSEAVQHFGPVLPYLFKVLAADKPLSIQAHPDKSQAESGFNREEKGGVPIDAPHRNYRDDNHKPEIICALTPFWGLNGFRSLEKAVSLLSPVCPIVLKNVFLKLENKGVEGLKTFFTSMMTLSVEDREKAVQEVNGKAKALAGTSPVYRWMVDLAREYPADMGVLSPALLNLICLSPGQAMFLPAGQLHAYLNGVGIELMANSDNVLRGGLTPKHVDVPELLRVVRFEETTVQIIHPSFLQPSLSEYSCPATEFTLYVIKTTKNHPYLSLQKRSVEILLCTKGEGMITVDEDGDAWSIKQGDSFLIPACLAPYRITGNAQLYKASVPLKQP